MIFYPLKGKKKSKLKFSIPRLSYKRIIIFFLNIVNAVELKISMLSISKLGSPVPTGQGKLLFLQSGVMGLFFSFKLEVCIAFFCLVSFFLMVLFSHFCFAGELHVEDLKISVGFCWRGVDR